VQIRAVPYEQTLREFAEHHDQEARQCVGNRHERQSSVLEWRSRCILRRVRARFTGAAVGSPFSAETCFLSHNCKHPYAYGYVAEKGIFVVNLQDLALHSDGERQATRLPALGQFWDSPIVTLRDIK
jgi:hypothetical protein